MRIYLDVSCLNRPFDDQRQARVRLEADAVTLILERIEQHDWSHVASQMALIEIDAHPNPDQRERVRLLLPGDSDILPLNEPVFRRGQALQSFGFKPADALHLAAAESLQADVFLTCDDRLLRAAKRHASHLEVAVANPLDWLRDHSDANDT